MGRCQSGRIGEVMQEVFMRAVCSFDDVVFIFSSPGSRTRPDADSPHRCRRRRGCIVSSRVRRGQIDLRKDEVLVAIKMEPFLPASIKALPLGARVKYRVLPCCLPRSLTPSTLPAQRRLPCRPPVVFSRLPPRLSESPRPHPRLAVPTFRPPLSAVLSLASSIS